jgi:phosphatidate cytidylyltransferase
MRLTLNRYNNLTQRLVTGLIGAGLVIYASYFSEWTYFVVFLVISCLSILEFYRLTGLDGMLPLKYIGTLNAMLIFVLSFFVENGICNTTLYFIIFPSIALIFLIKLYKKEKKPFTNIAYTLLGIIYVGLPFALLNISVYADGGYNYQIIIGILLLLWASDTGGYIAGVLFGRTKLFERVSPKKSWEGMVGSFILAMVIATFIVKYFDVMTWYQWYLVAVIMVVAGTYGDLVESLFKRSIEIKDSGSSLPGHGGFLDRFDGLLISIPFIVFLLKVFIF